MAAIRFGSKQASLFTGFTLLFVFAVLFSPAQVTFQKTFGGNSFEYGKSAYQTNDGGYILGGYTKSFGVGDIDFYLLKTNSIGTLDWARTYGGTGTDFGRWAIPTNDGGFAIGGCTDMNATGYDFYLVKTATDGTIQWTKTYGGTADEEAYCLQQTNDGGYILSGYTRSFGLSQPGGNDDMYVVKTASDGSLQWSNAYGGSSIDYYAYSLKQTNDGGFVVTGSTYSFGQGFNDVYLVKTASDGSIQWTKTFGGSVDDYGNSVQQTADGGYVVCGYSNSFSGSAGNDIYLVKTSSDGNMQWTKTYGGTNSDVGWSVYQTPDAGFVITGGTRSYGAGNDDVFLVKTTSDGTLQWSQTFGGSQYEVANSVRQTSDGGFVLCGYTNTFGPTLVNVYLIKTDATGNVGCNQITPPLPSSGTGGIMSTGGFANPGGVVNSGGSSVNVTLSSNTFTPCSPSLFSTISSTSVTCNAQCNGTATASPAGGTAPFTFSWTSGQSTSSVSNLCAGNYTVTVTDGATATTTQTVSIAQPTALTSTASSTATACGSSNGTAAVMVAGGTGSYTYLWNPGGQSTSSVSGLSPGNYSATITDANGCTQTQTVSITNSNGPNAVMSQVNVLCNGQCTGTASAVASGGAQPYSYSWTNGQSTSAANNLCAGSYSVTVSDNLGCSSTQVVTITQPAVISLTLSSTPAVCTSATGTGSVSASGGSGPYAYLWNPSAASTSAASGLSAGNYSVTVTDANGCPKTQTVTVSSISSLTVGITATQTGCATNSGTAAANPGNGTAPYSYSWNNAQTTQVATGLAAGNYTVTITDTNGCTQTQTVSITQTAGLVASASASSYSITAGLGVTLTAGGGGTYVWSTGQTTSVIYVMPSTTSIYCVFVTDASNCTDSICITISVELPCGQLYLPNAFSPNKDFENDEECVFGGCIEIFHLAIYNRWGEKVFESSDPKLCWDGMHRGKLLDPAVFNYYLEATLTDGTKTASKGNISLIR